MIGRKSGLRSAVVYTQEAPKQQPHKSLLARREFTTGNEKLLQTARRQMLRRWEVESCRRRITGVDA